MSCRNCASARKAKVEGYVACAHWNRQGPKNVPDYLEAYLGWAYLYLGPDDRPDTATSHLMAPEQVLLKEDAICRHYEPML